MFILAPREKAKNSEAVQLVVGGRLGGGFGSWLVYHHHSMHALLGSRHVEAAVLFNELALLSLLTLGQPREKLLVVGRTEEHARTALLPCDCGTSLHPGDSCPVGWPLSRMAKGEQGRACHVESGSGVRWCSVPLLALGPRILPFREIPMTENQIIGISRGNSRHSGRPIRPSRTLP